MKIRVSLLIIGLVSLISVHSIAGGDDGDGVTDNGLLNLNIDMEVSVGTYWDEDIVCTAIIGQFPLITWDYLRGNLGVVIPLNDFKKIQPQVSATLDILRIINKEWGDNLEGLGLDVGNIGVYIAIGRECGWGVLLDLIDINF